MKNVIFNILTVLILLATVGVGAVYAAVLFSGGGPDLSALSSISAAPGPELPTALVLPSVTATARKLAPTWTETANAVATYDAARRLTSSTPIPAGSIASNGLLVTATIYTIPTYTPIPTATLVPTLTYTPITPTYTPTNTYTPYPTGTPLPTSTPRPTDNLAQTAIANSYLYGTATALAMNLSMTQDALNVSYAGRTATSIAALTATQVAIPTQTAAADSQTKTAIAMGPYFTQTAIAASQTAVVLALPTNPVAATETAHGITSGVWQKLYTDPAFAWFNPSGATGYDVYWGTDPQGTPEYFATPIASASSSASPKTAYVPSAISPPAEATYYLRVRTHFDALVQSNYTTLFTFRYDNVPPTNPNFPASVSGASDDTWQNSVKSPTFNVSGASDGGSGGIKYQYYWGTNASTPTLVGGLTSSASFSPGSLADGTYYLFTQVQDALGNTPGSPFQLFTFKLDTVAPAVPTGVTVIPAVDYLAGNANDYKAQTPEFTWNTVVNDLNGALDLSGIQYYEYYWDKVYPGNNDVTGHVSGTRVPPSTMIPCNPYYFRVRAKDWANNASPVGWSNIITLTYRDATCPLP
jgi:hypothetical protein